MHTTKLLVAIAALSMGLASAKDRTKRLHTPHNKKNGGNNKNDSVMDEEDVVFWTRLLQGGDERGKETEIGSLPVVARPPSPSGGGGTSGGGAVSPPRPKPTPKPVPKPTPRPIPSPTPPSPTPPSPTPPTPSAPTFRCPAAGLVGCTAPDPTQPEDECSEVGERCAGSNVDFCCQDGCPRLYCTAKQAPN